MSHEDDFYAFYQALEQGRVPQDVIVASTTVYQTPMWLVSKVWPTLPGPRVMARLWRQSQDWQKDLQFLQNQPTLQALRRRFLADLLRKGFPQGYWSWNFSTNTALSRGQTQDMTRYRAEFVPRFLQHINPDHAGLAAFAKPLHHLSWALPDTKHERLSLLSDLENV